LLAAVRKRGLSVDGVNEHAALPHPAGIVIGFASAPAPALRRGVAMIAESFG
jgi:hypothetical protein